MMRAGRAALVAAAGLLFAAPSGAQSLRRATVTVTDHLGSGQQEETISVYFAGVLAGTLHVDRMHPDDSFVTTVPDQDSLVFTLCGKLLRREEGGATSSYPIDNGGQLSGYKDARLDAVTLGDVLFTLRDRTSRAEVSEQPGPACTAAVS